MQSTGVTFLTILDRFMCGTLHVYKSLASLFIPVHVLCHTPAHTPSQSVLSGKQCELDECVGRVRELEGLLRVAQRQTDKATILNMKKVESHSTFCLV